MSVISATTDVDVRTVTVLGSTGSVGRNTLDLISRNRQRYDFEVLAANTNETFLAEQARRFRPELTVIADKAKYLALKEKLAGTGLAVEAGRNALIEAAKRPTDWVMAAIVGTAGLEPTASARHGAIVALANKEALVCAGELLIQEIHSNGGTLLPVDSEHNAIFQVFDFGRCEALQARRTFR